VAEGSGVGVLVTVGDGVAVAVAVVVAVGLTARIRTAGVAGSLTVGEAASSGSPPTGDASGDAASTAAGEAGLDGVAAAPGVAAGDAGGDASGDVTTDGVAGAGSGVPAAGDVDAIGDVTGDPAGEGEPTGDAGGRGSSRVGVAVAVAGSCVAGAMITVGALPVSAIKPSRRPMATLPASVMATVATTVRFIAPISRALPASTRASLPVDRERAWNAKHGAAPACGPSILPYVYV